MLLGYSAADIASNCFVLASPPIVSITHTEQTIEAHLAMSKERVYGVLTLLALILLSLMQNEALPADALSVADLDALPFNAPPDDLERTNLDNLTYTGLTNIRSPIPLEDGQTIPKFNLDTTTAGHKGVARITRQAVTSSLVDYLFFGNRQFLVRINRDRTGIQALQPSPQSNVIAVDYNIRDGYLFWSDVLSRVIARSNMDGTNITVIVQTNITVPDGIAWDWVNKKLYWTDAEQKDIEVIDPESGDRKVLLQTGVGATSIPRAIVLDPTKRKMYWTDWGTSPRIERASMDGTSRTTLLSVGLQWPNALSLDINTQTLYWADAGDLYNRIESSDVNGNNRRVVTTSYVFHPFGIDIFNGVLFWTDWQLKAVLYVPIAQPTAVGVIISNLLMDPMGLRVVSMSKQPMVTNPCASESNNCNGLCLLSSSDKRKYTCVCPQGSYWSTDRTSCISGSSGNQCTPPCQNGGVCSLPGICTCASGWTGNRCHIAICTPHCLNGGTCTAPDSCSCTSDWEGYTCNQAICADGFCQNNGSCIRPGLCSCPAGWVGTRCDQSVCSKVCEHGRCTGPDTCTCSHGWTGALCNQAVCNPPCVNGSCERPDVCICHTGWKGHLCSDPICEPSCVNGGDCIAPNTCECHPPYYGSTCSQVTCFPPSGCLNGGHCVSFSLCACAVGWTGFRCQTPQCGSIRCLHGTCHKPDDCSCNRGWHGISCDEALCFPPDGCLHGGQCITPGICSCASGWTGVKCDEAVCSHGCNHGDCIKPDVCQCDEGWSGNTCNDAICLPECQNDGHCIRPNLCVCQPSNHGYRCNLFY